MNGFLAERANFVMELMILYTSSILVTIMDFSPIVKCNFVLFFNSRLNIDRKYSNSKAECEISDENSIF